VAATRSAAPPAYFAPPETTVNQTLGRILLGLPGLFILASGLVFLFNPGAAAAKLSLEPQSIDGLSNMRGFLGAPIIAVGISILMSAITRKLEYARPGVLFLFALVFARLLSRGIDGPVEALGLYVAVPTIAFGFMLAGHKLLVAGGVTADASAPRTDPDPAPRAVAGTP